MNRPYEQGAPQMTVLLNTRARALLHSAALGHLVTMNADGSPQVSIVWVGLDDGEIVCAHMLRNQKVRNIERDPRVVVSIEADGHNEMGLAEYFVGYGTARIVEGGAAELLQRLAHVYLGPDVVFPPMPNPPPGYVTRIQLDRVTGVGDWAD
jgi:PPOX class probable F420-dependent enzyme